MKPIRRDNRIPRRPFLWLTAALVFTVPPMFGALAPWVPALFLAALAAKFWMEPRDYRLRQPLVKLILGPVVLAAVFATYGSIEGIEPGVSIVVILMALKILEAHTAREFQVMANIGWILCLCGFFLSQDFAVALCLLFACALVLASLIEFHRGASVGSIWMPTRTAIKMILQAAPLIVVLFLFFPRVNFGVRLPIPGSQMAGAGFSGQLSPGSVSSLANSSEIAFRVAFPDGGIPRPGNLYWRGVVLTQGNGLEWRAPTAPAALPRSSRRLPASAAIRQSITLEPHSNRWMFALDWPADPPPGATLAPGNYLWSAQPIRGPKKYQVDSFAELADKTLRQRERKLLLHVPQSVSPQVRELAQSWAKQGGDSAAIVARGLQFFHDQNFRYSLTPGEYRNNDLDAFLFNRRVGFCEHYAASFATLMRLAGVPARVVIGYLGGEYNEIGQFFIVRQSDSHAWCEVWLPAHGWKRVDPTNVVAPDRVALGLNGFLERRTAGASPYQSRGIVGSFSHLPFITRARLAWQAVAYAWDTRVLSFDEAAQDNFFSSIPMFGGSPVKLLTGITILIFVAGASWIGWIRFRTRAPRDTVRLTYNTFCEKLGRLGVSRVVTEGPSDFATRAAQSLPAHSDRIKHISNIYIQVRYAGSANRGLTTEFTQQVRAF